MVCGEVQHGFLCNSCCFLSPLISLHTLNAVTFCQQHLISSGTLRDSCNTLSSLHISSSPVHRHYHTVILTTSVKTICKLTVTYQRKWYYKSWLTLWESYCVCDLSFRTFSRVGSRCKETSEENNNNNMVTVTANSPDCSTCLFSWHGLLYMVGVDRDQSDPYFSDCRNYNHAYYFVSRVSIIPQWLQMTICKIYRTSLHYKKTFPSNFHILLTNFTDFTHTNKKPNEPPRFAASAPRYF